MNYIPILVLLANLQAIELLQHETSNRAGTRHKVRGASAAASLATVDAAESAKTNAGAEVHFAGHGS